MFQAAEIHAIYLHEASRYPVAPIARMWPDYRAEYSNFRVLQRVVVIERGPRQLTFSWSE